MMTNKRSAEKKPVEDIQKALAIAAEYLERRPLSERQLREKLLKRNVLPDLVEETIEYCMEYNYINDQDFAKLVIESYKNKGYGIRRIEQELFKRGISKEISGELLSDFQSDDEKIDVFIQKKLKSVSCIDKAAIKKVTDALIRRGFTYEQINNRIRYYNNLEEDELWLNE